VILLDTHVLLWVVADDRRLGRRTRRLLDQSWPANEVCASALSFWEIGLLLERGRIRMRTSLSAWRGQQLDAGLRELPLDGPVAVRAADLHALAGDPVDRLIAATAIRHDALLVTADERLLSWKHTLKRQDAQR
jgi:PIN domain nuclease of toxin-antitoxin system